MRYIEAEKPHVPQFLMRNQDVSQNSTPPARAFQHPAIGSLEDFTEYRDATTKLREIADELNAVTGTLAAVEQELQTMRGVFDKVREAARARLEDRQMPVRSTLERDRLDLQFKRDALRIALAEQSDGVSELRGNLALELLLKARPAHRKLIGAVLKSANDLVDAIARENEFRRELRRRRIVTSLAGSSRLPAVPIEIVSGLGNPARVGSPISVFRRVVAGYNQP